MKARNCMKYMIDRFGAAAASGFATFACVSEVLAQEGQQTTGSTDALLGEIGKFFSQGATLLVALLAFGVVAVAGYVIVSSLIQVSRERRTWGEVMGNVIGAGVVALIVAVIASYANELIPAIGSLDGANGGTPGN